MARDNTKYNFNGKTKLAKRTLVKEIVQNTQSQFIPLPKQ